MCLLQECSFQCKFNVVFLHFFVLLFLNGRKQEHFERIKWNVELRSQGLIAKTIYYTFLVQGLHM